MIIMFAFALLQGILETVFSIIPDIPPTPQALIDGTQTAITWLTQGTAVIMELVSRELYEVFFVLFFATLLFEYGYIAVMWVLRKIPWVAID